MREIDKKLHSNIQQGLQIDGLLNAGASASAQNTHGFNALHIAVIMNKHGLDTTSTIQLLVNRHPELLEAQCRQNLKPIEHASNEKIIGMLTLQQDKVEVMSSTVEVEQVIENPTTEVVDAKDPSPGNRSSDIDADVIDPVIPFEEEPETSNNESHPYFKIPSITGVVALSIHSHSPQKMTTQLFEQAKEKAKEFAGITQLHTLAKNGGSSDEVQRLVDEGYDVNAKTTFFGNTPAIHALKNNHVDIAKAVLNNGADPSLENLWGQDARSIANNSLGAEELNDFIPYLTQHDCTLVSPDQPHSDEI